MKFSDLEVGKKFIYNEKEYTKVAKLKISCCKSINAVNTNDKKDRVLVSDDTEVVVNE